MDSPRPDTPDKLHREPVDDLSYILIKREISDEFLDELFAHTRRIREGKLLDADQVTPKKESGSQDLLPTRKYRYSSSKCTVCDRALSHEVSLRGSTLKRSVGEHHNSTARGTSSQMIDIVSSRMPSYGKTVLYKADSTDQEQKTQFSWIHADRAIQDLDEFIRFASSVPILTDENRALVLSLAKRMTSNIHSSKCAGPNNLFRCDGVSPPISTKTTSDRSAILMRFPYSSIRKLGAGIWSSGESESATKSLIQYNYPFRPTKKRDLDQVVQKTGLFPSGHVVHIQELWAVIVNFRYIITSAPASLLDQRSSSYEILSPSATTTPSSPMICVLDPRERLFSFEVKYCKTFFALRYHITKNCLPIGFKDKGYDFELLAADGNVIKAEDWPKISSTHSSTVLYLQVRLLYPEPKNKTGATTSTKESESKDDRTEETVEERSGTHSTSGNDHSDWALVRYTMPFQYRKKDSERPGQRKMQPVTSISGVVVNDEPKDHHPPKENIYFEPRRQYTSIKDNDSIEGASSVQNDKSDEHDHVGKEPGPLQRSGTFDSLFDDPSAPSPNDKRKTGLKLEFPPVFTWSTNRKPSLEESSMENTTPEDSSPASHPTESAVESKQTSATVREATLHANHESLVHVSSDLHEQLLEGQAIYEAASVSSHFEADQAIRKNLNVYLPFLIADDRKSETAQDPVTWDFSLKSSIGGMCRLLNFFIPLEFPCEIIPQLCEPSKMKELTERAHRHRMGESYYIIDLDDARFSSDLLNDKDIEVFELDSKVEDCTKCTKSRQFSTRADAIDHLSTHHSGSPARERSEKSPESWYALVLPYGEYLTFLCRIDGQKILHQLRDQVESLENMAVQIQLGVSEGGNSLDRDTYRIPSSLVDAFQNFLMMVATAAHMAKAISQARESYKERDPPPSFLLFSELHSITGFAVKSWDFMEKAGSDIMLMTQTGEAFDVVSHEVVSPSLVLALIIDDIYFTDSEKNRVNMIEIYRGYMLDLQFQAFRNPQRRLLQDIYFFAEELGIAQDILKQQLGILVDYLRVLHPASFRITTESRISSYDLEEKQLQRLINRIRSDYDTIEELLAKITSVATMTLHGVDVRQEDQGKAILIFTIVTVVFTPLSFVTSYLGMNTIDIRNMNNSQTLFWAVSIPLTMVIISIVLFVALQAERVRDAFEGLFKPHHLKRRRNRFIDSPENDGDDEDYLDSMLEQLPGSKGKKRWRQRLRGWRTSKDRRSQPDSSFKV
ncbi:hypothetical protein N7493_004905 [Penicillium malachiteum]|uniref:Mg2+ transporter protein, CorA-like/Zinc transport protein ZntB n=1 Tax=Penicillium malachiteum TaxID=1324776 RepID=A0AAD6HM25_9EURO|nr:hypothetical protein N7493_004905 [Penicillium malachiteum]